MSEDEIKKQIEASIQPATIFVGRKPIMNYVYACQQASKTAKQVKIVARGNFIPDAVTIAEIYMRKLGKHNYVAEVGSIEAVNKRGKNVFVSTISITVTVV